MYIGIGTLIVILLAVSIVGALRRWRSARVMFDLVEKLGPGLYRCKICDTIIETAPHHDPPLSMVISQSGERDQRVVMISGQEIHRCPFPPFSTDCG